MGEGWAARKEEDSIMGKYSNDTCRESLAHHTLPVCRTENYLHCCPICLLPSEAVDKEMCSVK